MVDKTDREIITKVLNGDTDLFCLLVRKYEKQIFNYIFRMVRMRQESEDLAQDTFTKAYSSLKKYDDSYEFSTWVYRIALNVCRDFFRRKKFFFFSLQGPVGDEEDSELEDFIPQDSFLSPDGIVLNQELRIHLEEAIKSLPLKFREVIVLRHIDDLSYEQISDITGLPVGTVKTYLHRARKKLQENLRNYLD
ncbi:MAG: sigma-70 family RNA polymerase sigma factor [Atribacterota bacterium]|nr:sigma-70 family RNA polymerase sigma factor [Candidatus Atribacteria bacterium]